MDIAAYEVVWRWNGDRRIPNDTVAGKKALEELLAQLGEHGWGEEHTFGVHLAFEEALINAIKHGNQDDPEKSIELILRVSPEAVLIRITDEGPGFNPADVPDPTLEENLEVPSGRGLMLMRTFMSSIEYNDVGNSVTMFKRLSDEENNNGDGGDE